MCRTRQPRNPPIMLAKRRPRYSPEEKKLIAKNKAKKRRDEETSYFNRIESLIKGEFSPFIDLPEKKILSVTLRLANAWKISYFILHSQRDSPFTSQGKLLPKQSILRDVSDSILLILYRLKESDQDGPFVILYSTSSVHQYLHITNSHELFGSKFEDYCCEDGDYINMRAPISQKEKRTYPSVRCRILRSCSQIINDRHELRYYLLQAPLYNKGGKNSAEKLETATRIGKEDFQNYSPQYWRAMQARRRAVRRGAPRSVMIPEQLRRSRTQMKPAETPFVSYMTPAPFTNTCEQLQANNITEVSPMRHRNLAELSKMLTEKTFQYTDAVYLSPPENRDSGMSTPRLSSIQGNESGMATPVGSVFELQHSPGVSSSISPCPVNSSTDSNRDAELLAMETPFLSTLQSSDLIIKEIAQTIDPYDPIVESDISSSFDTSLSNINPTIGIEGGQRDVTEQMSKLSMSDFESNQTEASLSALLADGDSVDQALKIEPVDLIKPEPHKFSDVQERTEIIEVENAKVLFTADCRREDLSHLHNFLVNTPSPTYGAGNFNESNPVDLHEEYPELPDTLSKSNLLRRTLPSQNLLEMESKESMEKMELGSSCGSFSSSKYPGSGKPTGMKTSYSSGESFSAPRYIGDSRMGTQHGVDLTNPSAKIILSESDVEMRGTPPNSIGQDLSDMGGIPQKMSLTSVTDEQPNAEDVSANHMGFHR